MRNRNSQVCASGFLLLPIAVGIALSAVAGCDSGSGVIQAGNVRILDTRTDLTDRARAKQNVEDALTRYPDIDCLVGLWAYNGPAILEALKDAKKAGEVPIVAFDENDNTLQGIADGYIHATVVQQPYYFGYHSVRILATLARGDKSVLPEDEVYDIPVQIVRKDSVTKFWDTLKKLVAGEEDSPSEGEPSSAKPPPGETVQVAFVTNNPSNFWRIAYAGIKKAEKEFNAECAFLTPPDGTAADQQRMVESLIAKGVSGMAISPNDAENQIDLLNQAAKVMNVICHDSDCRDSNRLCYVGTNNYQAGREAGKLIQEVLPQGGDIMIFVGRMDAQNAIDRRQGLIDQLKGVAAKK